MPSIPQPMPMTSQFPVIGEPREKTFQLFTEYSAQDTGSGQQCTTVSGITFRVFLTDYREGKSFQRAGLK